MKVDVFKMTPLKTPLKTFASHGYFQMGSLEKNIQEQIKNDENEIQRLEMEERKTGFTDYTTPMSIMGGKPKRRNSRVTMATEATVFEYDDTYNDRGTREDDPGYFI